jgi:hypothetical protein
MNYTKKIDYQLIKKTMKKILIILVAIVLMAGYSNIVKAQSSATVTGVTAGAVLITPMTITKTADLHFGTINVLAGSGGTVTLPSSSTVRVFSAGVSASAVNPQPTNAAFNVTGTKNETYALTLPSTITVTETVGNTATMTISSLTARFNGAGADATTSTLSTNGTDNFTLGGTLTVAASQVAGIYAGTFNVTVDYN